MEVRWVEEGMVAVAVAVAARHLEQGGARRHVRIVGTVDVQRRRRRRVRRGRRRRWRWR